MIIIFICLGASAVLNLVFTALLFKKPAKPPPQPTYDVQALLRDMASGPALLKIEYVDRADVLLRSPRHFS